MLGCPRCGAEGDEVELIAWTVLTLPPVVEEPVAVARCLVCGTISPAEEPLPSPA